MLGFGASPAVGASDTLPTFSHLLMETGDALLTETGNTISLE